MRWSLVRVFPWSLLLMVACSAPPPSTSSSPSLIDGASVWERYRDAAGNAALAEVRGLRATGIAVDPTGGANRRLLIEAEAPARYRPETPERSGGPDIRQLVGYNGTIGWRAGDTHLAGEGQLPAVTTRG